MASMNKPMNIPEEQGKVVVEPMAFDIDTLVAGITDQNQHEVIEMGLPVGRELW